MCAESIIDLGFSEYEPVWNRMKEMRLERRLGKIPDTLLLVEHPHVITVGVQGSDGDVFPPGVPVYHVERGGKATYHGPGQQVGYPIVDLNPRGNDVRRFVHDIEELVADAIRPMGIEGSRVDGKRGVWVHGRKIASVGIAVQDWITYHGFALNVKTDLTQFEAFHPCGFEGKIMTSLERELRRPVDLAEVKPRIKDGWKRLFGSSSARA